jgi:hypothetical protein
LIWLLAACTGVGTGVAAWVDTYVAAQNQADTDLRAALEACASIPDAGLQRGCALQAIDRGGRNQGGIDRWCPSLADPVAQAECWFRAAEDDQWRRDGTQAIAHCARAGAFAVDCTTHLWMREQDALVQSEPRMVESWPAANALHDHWAGPLASLAPDFSDTYWKRYYNKFFETAAPLDLPGCRRLPADGQVRCTRVTLSTWEARMKVALQAPATRAALCALAAPDSRASAQWVGAFPDPQLDALVSRMADTTCR